MRIGNSKSESYKRLHARRAARKRKAVERLCHRLDALVTRGETLKSGRTRATFLKRAEEVRQKLRELDH